MLRNRAWALAGLILVSACNSSKNDEDSTPASGQQEDRGSAPENKTAKVEAYPAFADAIKFAFSGEFQENISNAMAQNAPQVAAGLGNAAFEFTCATMYETRGLAAPSDAASFNACGIIARVSKNLPDAEKENLFRAEFDGEVSARKVWEGQAKFQNRTLPATMLEARFGIINRAAGFKRELCVRELYVDDQEFSVRRGSQYLSCNPEDPEQIKEAMAANEVLTPYQTGATAVPVPSSSTVDVRQNGQPQVQKLSTHEQAVADNKLSTQAIMAAWKAIDASTRADILPKQRAWIKSKDANCSAEAASASLDQTERETARLTCDTKANGPRIQWLKQYLPQ